MVVSYALQLLKVLSVHGRQHTQRQSIKVRLGALGRRRPFRTLVTAVSTADTGLPPPPPILLTINVGGYLSTYWKYVEHC